MLDCFSFFFFLSELSDPYDDMPPFFDETTPKGLEVFGSTERLLTFSTLALASLMSPYDGKLMSSILMESAKRREPMVVGQGQKTNVKGRQMIRLYSCIRVNTKILSRLMSQCYCFLLTLGRDLLRRHSTGSDGGDSHATANEGQSLQKDITTFWSGIQRYRRSDILRMK